MPFCIRASYLRVLTQVLAEIDRSHRTLDGLPAADPRRADASNVCARAWKLFLILPRMLLHKTRRGGEAGKRNLQERIRLFDAGRWDLLLERSSQPLHRGSSNSAHDLLERRLLEAVRLAEQGELSHAARVLRSTGMAPGTDATLQELTDLNLRPPVASEPLPDGLPMFVPSEPLELDKQIFSDTLRSSRRGLSSGVSGNRNEYLKLVLEDDVAFDLLFAASSRLARAEVPECIAMAMKVSKLTATLKPNGRVRGLAAGEVFRRLTSKCIAKQKHTDLRDAVSPMNFGLSNRSGTDALVHFLQYLSDAYPNKVIMSIDGVGAFDHVCRARIFEQLGADPRFHCWIPFVRQ